MVIGNYVGEGGCEKMPGSRYYIKYVLYWRKCELFGIKRDNVAGTQGRRGNVTHEEAERADQSGPFPLRI